MPMNIRDYPENWKWLSKQIIADAGNKCELCYAPNGQLVFRDKTDLHPWRAADVLLCDDPDYKLTKIILTVHHIDSDKQNNAKQNLISLCQRCHLRLDLQKHIKNRNESRNDKRQNIELLL
jgi:hypothetical protein